MCGPSCRFKRITLKRTRAAAVFFALLAALLYALSAPFSKLLLNNVAPAMLAALLYLGAGAGMLIIGGILRMRKRKATDAPLTKGDFPYVLGMIVLDIAAPILLMFGLASTSAENASLLNNFEIVATSIFAWTLFHEAISRKLWISIGLVTLASALLTFSGADSLQFSPGSLFVLLACCCWGLENNCTRRLSDKNPLEIVVIKGIFSGSGALIVALLAGAEFPSAIPLLLSMLLGFVAYGLSIYFYVYAQRTLGAAKTSVYYAVAPFIGALLSLVIFRTLPSVSFIIALVLMLLGAALAYRE